MYEKIQDSGRHSRDERKISIGINANQKYDYSRYRKVRDAIKVGQPDQVVSVVEIGLRVAVLAYYVYLFESGQTDRPIRTQMFAWVLVHFACAVFAGLTVASLLKSEVTDFKTYYRLKV